MTNKAKNEPGTLFKKLGWTGIVLCGLCCALPFIGMVVGIGSLAVAAVYMEKIAILALGLAGIFFVYHLYQRKKSQKESCQTSCETDCNCKTESELSDKIAS